MRVSVADLKQFGRATEIAQRGEHHRVRVGAILTRGRTTLRRSHNRVAFGVEPFKAGHAERLVIEGQPAFKGTLYVVRLDLNNEWVASWPCEECMAHIVACSCVTKIVFHDGTKVKKVRV